VVTQLLNFILETFVPLAINRVVHRERWKVLNTVTEAIPAMIRAGEEFADELTKAVTPHFHIRARKSCGDNQPRFEDVIIDMSHSAYTTFADYDDMVMQWGYVVMFSVVWSWIPFIAMVNNVFEVRGDAFKLFYQHRRPIPRKVKSIGSWERCLEFVLVFGLVCNVALICISTGHLEWFFPSCHQGWNGRFGPDLTCFDHWGERFAYAAMIEHVGLICQFLVFSLVPVVPLWVAKRILFIRTTMRCEIRTNVSAKGESIYHNNESKMA